MRVFITGICGFAGSHLAELCLKEGCHVSGLVKPAEDTSHLENVKNDIHLYEADLTDKQTLMVIFKNLGVDAVFHLAAETSAHKSFHFPEAFFTVNVLGTINLLEAIRGAGISPRILLVTSSEIYGFVTPDQLPINERASFHPESPYAVSKITVHFLGKQYFRNYGLPIIEARAFNHIGPRQAKGFVVPDFCSQIADIRREKQEPVIRVGNLTEKRDFLDVRDVVKAYKMLVTGGSVGSAYNICSGFSISVNTVLDTLIKLSGTTISIEHDPLKMRPSRMPDIRGDNNKIRQTIDWKPAYHLETSLTDTLNYWLNR